MREQYMFLRVLENPKFHGCSSPARARVDEARHHSAVPALSMGEMSCSRPISVFKSKFDAHA